jgi:hypothetical protein
MTAIIYGLEAVTGLAQMFATLDCQPIRCETHGDMTVRRYAANVRRVWHKTMSGTSLFDISVINNSLLQPVHNKLSLESVTMLYEAR